MLHSAPAGYKLPRQRCTRMLPRKPAAVAKIKKLVAHQQTKGVVNATAQPTGHTTNTHTRSDAHLEQAYHPSQTYHALSPTGLFCVRLVRQAQRPRSKVRTEGGRQPSRLQRRVHIQVHATLHLMAQHGDGDPPDPTCRGTRASGATRSKQATRTVHTAPYTRMPARCQQHRTPMLKVSSPPHRAAAQQPHSGVSGMGRGGGAGHRTETDPTTEERAKIEVNKRMPVPARHGPNYPHQRHTPRELLDNTHCAVLPSSAVLSSSAPAGIDNTHARHKQGASSSYTLT